MTKRVGIVGIGIMGTAMMRNLVKDGFEVVGYDIAEQAMARLAEAGGITAASPRLSTSSARGREMSAEPCSRRPEGCGACRRMSCRRCRAMTPTCRKVGQMPARSCKSSVTDPITVKRFSPKKLNRDAGDRTLCRDAYRTARAQNVRPGSFWSFAAPLDQ